MTRSVYEREIISPRLFALLGALVIAFLLALAFGAQGAETPPTPHTVTVTPGVMVFLPMGIYYVNGALVKADMVENKDGTVSQFESSSDCFDFIKKAMLAAVKSGSMGGSIVGACFPVRRVDPTGAVSE